MNMPRYLQPTFLITRRASKCSAAMTGRPSESHFILSSYMTTLVAVRGI